MTGKNALPVAESAGYLVMVDITHPVTRDVIIHAGTAMDSQLIDVAAAEGVDYVVVYKHPPVLRNLEDHTTSDILQELIDRMEHTNGLDFCSVTSILQARDMITAHLAAV
jgi:hypothetical protein